MASHRTTLFNKLFAAAVLGSLSAYSPGQVHKPVKRDLSKGNTMYVVPYAHLDTQWRWAYPQVIREFIGTTLRRNFELIDRYPNYIFNFSGSRRYEFMRDYYPDEYQRLKGYVKAGRWFPAGSSVDEADANVPSAESLIRHVLYGNRFFRHEFGVASQEFMLPDCFGFPYALPSVLAHCGVKGFSTQKLTWGSAIGIPFKVGTWEGPDGNSVVAALDPGSYAGDVDEDLSENTSWLARIQNTGKQSGAFVDYHYYGTGDIGGGPRDDSVAWVEKSIQGKGPIKVVSSHSDEMFMSLNPAQIAKLPHYKGELLLTQHSAGSISSQAYMKRWNRKNELLADAAERASVAAMWLGTNSYPSQRLYNAWDLVLGSQMHDMLPGTSIPKAYEFCWNDELLAQNQFAAIETNAVSGVTSQMDTQAQGVPLVVFNPLSVGRTDVVEATLPNFGSGTPVAYGPDGKAVATQVLSRSGNDVTVLIEASAPSTGFAVYDVRSGPAMEFTSDVRVGENTLQNGRFKVTLNAGGDIASVFDKQENREVLKAPSRLEFQYHNPSAFPAWNMDWDDAKLAPDSVVDTTPAIEVTERGPVRGAIQITRVKNGSKFVQTVRLTAGGDRVEVANQIDWQTKEHALKVSFPMAEGNPLATYDLQVGAIQRGNNNEKKYEVPQHQWLDLSNPDNTFGVGILNDSKFGSDKPDDNTVRLTLLYTPGVRSGYSDQATQDFGRHDILYAIAPHAGDWRKGDVPWMAKRLNQPLRAFVAIPHAGSLGKEFSLVSTSSNQVEVTALKKSEDGNEVIVRLRELQGKDAKGVHVRFGQGIVSARQVDGQERPEGTAVVKGGELVADVPAYSLRAFAIKGAVRPSPKAAGTLQPIALAFDTDAASTAQNPRDGAFNSAGETYPAEQLPANLDVDGIAFRFGDARDGKANAMTAKGQVIPLPAGTQKVYVIAASSMGDVPATFQVGDRATTQVVQAWDGYIGQWDNRLWNADLGENFTEYKEWKGLAPGYVKPAEVAWFSNMKRNPRSGNEFYQYSYLYKYGLDVPAGATSMTLPNDARVKVFAITAATAPNLDQATPAAPLSDQLQGHSGLGQPEFTVSGESLNDATSVSIRPPLYWKTGELHYTLDGTDPSAASPVYTGALTLYSPTEIRAAEFADGISGPVASRRFEVRDTTSPRVVRASSAKVLGAARVEFSEPVVKATAEDPANYAFSSGAKVASAKLMPDGRSVELTLDRALAPGSEEMLNVAHVKDLSPSGNPGAGQGVVLEERVAVFTSPDDLKPGTSAEFKPEGLPVKATDSWTINLFCKPDVQPENLTLIAGFGRPVDGRIGTGRYFSKFEKGINFWISNRDVTTEVPLDLGKWQMLTATFDGTTVRLYKNGEMIAEEADVLSDDRPVVEVMPLDAWDRKRIFPGSVRNMTIWNESLSPLAIQRLLEDGKRSLP